MTERDILSDGVHRLGVAREGVVEALETYVGELRLWNSRIDLLSDAGETLVPRHILDSLAPVPLLRSRGVLPGDRGVGDRGPLDEGPVDERHAGGGRVDGAPGGSAAPSIADLGSGAGLPGIPLAIALPDARLTLVERSGRRAGFLRSTAAVLGLHNVEVQERRLEDVSGERFDLVVFRALTTFNAALARAARRLTRDGGGLCAYQGRVDSAERMSGELRGVFGSVEIAAIEVPHLDGERHIVLAS
jgi:16S rRNA (guanine527-N7)-methyltransferase